MHAFMTSEFHRVYRMIANGNKTITEGKYVRAIEV